MFFFYYYYYFGSCFHHYYTSLFFFSHFLIFFISIFVSVIDIRHFNLRLLQATLEILSRERAQVWVAGAWRGGVPSTKMGGTYCE